MGARIGAVATVTALALAVLAPTALSGAGGTDRPFAGTLAGVATFPADSTCPLGVRTVSEGSGIASHLGQITMASNHCFALPDLITQGHMTFVAANGDELHATYTGTSNPPLPSVLGELVTVSANLVFVGGTGRFLHATGAAHMIALVTFPGFDVPSWPATWSWQGTLSY